MKVFILTVIAASIFGAFSQPGIDLSKVESQTDVDDPSSPPAGNAGPQARQKGQIKATAIQGQEKARVLKPINYPPPWLTPNTLAVMRGFLNRKIKENPDRVADFVRLGFHACAGPDGCTGCIDVTDPHNRGLEQAVADLASWRRSQFFNFFIRTADWVALAAQEAAQVGLKNAGCADCVREFKVGRQTCSSVTNPKVDIPDGLKTDGVQRLQTLFGFTRAQAVILLGFGHSVGGCVSVCTGTWDNSTRAIDNRWFSALRSHDFTFQPNGNFKQFRNNANESELMMLAVDLKCGWDLEVDDTGKPTNCDHIKGCKPAKELFDTIFRLAGDETSFFKEGFDVYMKMIETSKQSLKALK